MYNDTSLHPVEQTTSRAEKEAPASPLTDERQPDREASSPVVCPTTLIQGKEDTAPEHQGRLLSVMVTTKVHVMYMCSRARSFTCSLLTL